MAGMQRPKIILKKQPWTHHIRLFILASSWTTEVTTKTGMCSLSLTRRTLCITNQLLAPILMTTINAEDIKTLIYPIIFSFTDTKLYLDLISIRANLVSLLLIYVKGFEMFPLFLV